MCKPDKGPKLGVRKPALAGHKYAGEFKDNKQNGQGTYTYADGSTYTGEFKDDVKTGQGTKTWGINSVFAGKYIRR